MFFFNFLCYFSYVLIEGRHFKVAGVKTLLSTYIYYD